MINEPQNLQDEIRKLEARTEHLSDLLKRREKLIQAMYESCLCERFKTKGFDYGEIHPKKGRPNIGSRWNTPEVLAENWIGFEWKYEKPEGACNSWKELKFYFNIKELTNE